MLLAFEVVLFGGLAFMFFCILRNQDSMLKTMREEHGAILSTLAKLEKRIATLQQLEASIAINPLAVQPPYPPEVKQELSQTWDRAPEPAEKHARLKGKNERPGSPRPFVSALNKNYSSPIITLRMTSISLASDPPPLHWASTSATSSRNIS